MAENRHDPANEPYRASFGNREDDRNVNRDAARAGGARNGHGRLAEEPEEPRSTRSSGPPLSIEAKAKLAEFEKKILRGEPMDDSDLEAAVQLGALNLMQAGRPSVRAAALKLMQDARIKKLASKTPEPPAEPGTSAPSGLNVP